tara:strand:+ start:123 stop:854 length:732 start_codon:yes stop_codon:yes gene_type:complete
MSKLGYTWYPKDWGNSEAVFELNLTERGLYRELIDMAMLNDNKTVLNHKVWSRKFGSSNEEIETILITLENLGLIQIDFDGSNELFIPSCEPRLKLVRGGKNGGKKSRKSKPTVKPLVSLYENNDKPTPNQIEKKLNRKEIESEIHTHESFLLWFKQCRKFIGLEYNVKRLSAYDRQLFNELKDYTKEDYKTAFKNFSSDKYYLDNNLIFPKNFLKEDNFIKYLNQPITKELTLAQKLGGKIA